MKTNATYYTCIRMLLMAFTLLSLATSSTAQAPIFQFSNPSLESGNGNTLGAIYRFPSVVSGVDAKVEITHVGAGISLRNIDRTADGYSEAFQPEYRINGLSNAYIEFQITFVSAGTNTIVAQPVVDCSGLDIDGSLSGSTTLMEFNRIDMGGSGGVCTFNTAGSEISVSKIGSAFTASNITGVLYGALVDTAATPVMFSVTKNTVTTFSYRVGANNTMSGNSTRYASLYFKKFNYPDATVLSVPSLHNFTGVATDKNIALQWELTVTNNVRRIILEKSTGSSTSFQQQADFWVNSDGDTKTAFSYTDGKMKEASSYYRLKIITTDGKIGYSNVLGFKSDRTTANSFTVYPSQVSSAVTAQVKADIKQQASFEVYDYSGRKVYSQAVGLQAGDNNILINDLNKLPAGQYISAIKTTTTIYSQKIQKL